VFMLNWTRTPLTFDSAATFESIAYMAGEINSALYSSMQQWVTDGTIVPGRVVPNLLNVDYFDCANDSCSQTMASEDIITLLNNLP
jgi:hypothetical protein